ncbi:hypothetical protein KM043_004826 [Ampulex compressa]|nr:hypothetical protein KM043_004826 [Ampulex compressa]
MGHQDVPYSGREIFLAEKITVERPSDLVLKKKRYGPEGGGIEVERLNDPPGSISANFLRNEGQFEVRLLKTSARRGIVRMARRTIYSLYRRKEVWTSQARSGGFGVSFSDDGWKRFNHWYLPRGRNRKSARDSSEVGCSSEGGETFPRSRKEGSRGSRGAGKEGRGSAEWRYSRRKTTSQAL